MSAVVASYNVATDYDPPTDAAPSALLPSDDYFEFPELDVAPPSLRSVDSPGSAVDPPEDFTVDGSLAVRSAPEIAASVADVDPEGNSPKGPSLVDSDNGLFASRLPGLSKQLSRPCDVSFQETALNIPLLSSFALSLQLEL